MGRLNELNQVNAIREVLVKSVALTSGEKRYCTQNLSKWVEEDKTLNLLISKSSEISLDLRPLLKSKGLLA
ncbi:MAG TPA: hypothetical protein ENK94_04525 [Campylobacterales bacterium]|nr:hypothetical protein [Campylobacterales bacterium]